MLLLAVHVRLQQRHDQPMGRHVDANFFGDSHNRAAQPRQLQPAAALEILEH